MPAHEPGSEDDDLATTAFRGLKQVVVEETRSNREVVLHAAGASPTRWRRGTRGRDKARGHRVFEETVRSSSLLGTALRHPKACNALERRRLGAHVRSLSLGLVPDAAERTL
jgi:hypothetical protein